MLLVEMAQHLNNNVLYTAQLTMLSNDCTIFTTHVKTQVEFNNTAKYKRLMHIQHRHNSKKSKSETCRPDDIYGEEYMIGSDY